MRTRTRTRARTINEPRAELRPVLAALVSALLAVLATVCGAFAQAAQAAPAAPTSIAAPAADAAQPLIEDRDRTRHEVKHIRVGRTTRATAWDPEESVQRAHCVCCWGRAGADDARPTASYTGRDCAICPHRTGQLVVTLCVIRC